MKYLGRKSCSTIKDRPLSSSFKIVRAHCRYLYTAPYARVAITAGASSDLARSRSTDRWGLFVHYGFVTIDNCPSRRWTFLKFTPKLFSDIIRNSSLYQLNVTCLAIGVPTFFQSLRWEFVSRDNKWYYFNNLTNARIKRRKRRCV